MNKKTWCLQKTYELLKELVENGYFVSKSAEQNIPSLLREIKPLLSPQVYVGQQANFHCNGCDNGIEVYQKYEHGAYLPEQRVQCDECNLTYHITWMSRHQNVEVTVI